MPIYNDNHKSKNVKPIEYEIDKNNCWICVSHAKQKQRGNYPIITRYNKNYRLSRWILECELGEKVPEGMFVLHSCDNPECINPEHLSIGTPKENTQDMIKKGRKPIGESVKNSKLKEDQVLEIRKDSRSLKQIAKSYGVSKKTILLIKQRRTWKHI